MDRFVRWAVACVVPLLVLAACGTTAPDQSPSTQPSATGDGVSDGERTIVLAIGGESEDGYDPTLGWGRYGAPLFQSTLLRRDANLNIVNDLATGYTVSDDGLVWTVTIREDVVFSDGEPLTAQDVAYTFNTAATSGGLTDVTVLREAVALDDTTVELRLQEPQSTFINRLITLGIVPEHAHSADYARNPIGSGPFQMVQWDAGQQLIVAANPTYYGEPPALERLVFLFVDEDTAFAAARAGEVHVASVPQALAVQQIDGMRLYDIHSVDNRGLLFPYVPDIGDTSPDGHPIGNDVTADRAIRQAVNYAIDREALVAGVLEGFGSPAHGPVSGLPWEEPDAAIIDGDVSTAQQILADGGWIDADGDGIREKDGLRAAFPIVYPASDSTRQALALAAADMLTPLGIDVTVEGKSWDEIDALKHRHVIVFGWGSHDQTEMYNLYHSSSAGQGYYNTGYYANEQIDSLLDLAMGAATQEEAAIFWRAAQWDRDQEQGFTAQGDAAWAWLVNLDHTYFVDECLDIGQPQVEPHGHGWPITAGITDWTWTCTD
jgi:peptide/nickel transport system substrate-binding protein